MDTRPLLAALALALAPALAGAEPVTYTLDAERCEVVALTRPVGIGAGLSHPHVIEARQFRGKLVYDPEAPESSAVEVSLLAEALVNDRREARARHGLKGELSDKDRQTVLEHMRASEQLDTARYPQLTFSSSRVRKLGDGRLEVTGNLSIRGVSREVTLPVQVSQAGDSLRGEGSLTIKHTDFGFKPVSLLLGAIANADEIELRLLLVGTAPATQGP